MNKVLLGNRECFLIGELTAENILIQPVGSHDLDGLEREADYIRQETGLDFALVAVRVDDWNRDLSPWIAPAVFGTEDFGDGAEEVLAYIRDEIMKDKSRRYYLGGYSLAGFFALWAATECDEFSGTAGVSPSVWFPGWMDYFREKGIRTPKVYLSLGDREEKTRNPVMREVGNNIRAMHEILKKDHLTVLEWNPGNHFQQPDIRTARGFVWLLKEQTER